MKTILILACSLITVHTVLAQCNSNTKVISPISPKPTGPVVSLTCTSISVKWKGQTGQTFVLNATVKDAMTNKVINPSC